jgi:hypothetical protein
MDRCFLILSSVPTQELVVCEAEAYSTLSLSLLILLFSVSVWLTFVKHRVEFYINYTEIKNYYR